MKINNLFFIVFVVTLFFIASCTKSQLNEDLEFKKMCQDAGYEWMKMKPTQDGKFIKDAQECFGCMVQGIEHICDKTKFMEFVGKEDVSVDFSTNLKNVVPSKLITLTFSFKNQEGKPLQMEIEHEKLLHTIIISDDFSIFSHIHPEDSELTTEQMKKNSIFAINYTFPKSGRYLIGVNFASAKMDYSKVFYLDVAGNQNKQIKKDFSTEKIFDDYKVSLSLPQKLLAGKESTLSYYFEKDGNQLTNLEPYLGAPMHVVILKDDLTNFIHTHANIGDMEMTDIKMSMNMSAGMKMNMHELPSYFGPNLSVQTIFPEEGIYQIFGEFKHKGKVIITSFMVEVD